MFKIKNIQNTVTVVKQFYQMAKYRKIQKTFYQHSLITSLQLKILLSVSPWNVDKILDTEETWVEKHILRE